MQPERSLFALLLSVLALPVQAQTLRWDFTVLLDEQPIGEHAFVLENKGQTSELVSRARLEVKLLFLTAYRYVHDASESWNEQCLRELRSTTNDNGKRHVVRTHVADNALMVESDGKSTALQGCVMTFAYWNPAILKQTRLLNAQTGEYQPVDIVRLGEEPVTVRAEVVNANRYTLRGISADGEKMRIDLWYSLTGEWLQLESLTADGRRLRYVLKTGGITDSSKHLPSARKPS